MSKSPIKKPGAATPAGVIGEQAVTPKTAAPYIVGDCPMLHDGEVYMPGDAIYLTPEQARRSARRVSLLVAAFPTLNLE